MSQVTPADVFAAINTVLTSVILLYVRSLCNRLFRLESLFMSGAKEKKA